ncbi:MAG: hypothetical protein K0S33_122 [Bacteroidetes bacterium]|jgi:hypothetical protein|nr:hypothetical protein [Bacteroidota bacterium]
MKIRDLEDIQADIRYVSGKNENFFSWMFYNKERRLKELRQEEFNRLDLWLLENNEEYARLAADSMQCLLNLRWEMKVLQTESVGKNMPRVTGVKGGMDTDGNLRGIAFKEWFLASKPNPSCFIGRIDHHGNFYVEAVEMKDDPYGNVEPSFYRAIVGDKGHLLFEKGAPAQRSSFFAIDTQIYVLEGIVFSDTVMKSNFMENKKRLMDLINEQRVKDESGSFLFPPKKLF